MCAVRIIPILLPIMLSYHLSHLECLVRYKMNIAYTLGIYMYVRVYVCVRVCVCVCMCVYIYRNMYVDVVCLYIHVQCHVCIVHALHAQHDGGQYRVGALHLHPTRIKNMQVLTLPPYCKSMQVLPLASLLQRHMGTPLAPLLYCLLCPITLQLLLSSG
jgi:hypothetical protein